MGGRVQIACLLADQYIAVQRSSRCANCLFTVYCTLQSTYYKAHNTRTSRCADPPSHLHSNTEHTMCNTEHIICNTKGSLCKYIARTPCDRPKCSTQNNAFFRLFFLANKMGPSSRESFADCEQSVSNYNTNTVQGLTNFCRQLVVNYLSILSDKHKHNAQIGKTGHC